MTWIVAALIALLVLDTLRLRGRLGALVELPDSDEPPSPDHRFITAPGVTLSDATRRAASAWARSQRLDVVDLVPGDLPAIRALGLAQLSDLARVRRDRMAGGRTAGHALLVSADVAERARLQPPTDEVAFVRLAARLKQYAAGSFDHAVAPGARAGREDLSRRRAILRAILGSTVGVALAIQPGFWIILGLGLWLRPILGAVAFGVWQLQPLFAIAGTRVHSRDLALVTIARAPIELWLLIRTLVGGWRPPAGPDPVAARRDEYARLAADTALARYWEPRRDTCPVCGGRDLRVHLRVSDLMQHKPGRFTLERCRGCGHVFQNPRLSIAGLDYYYKDFYDGLGEEGMDFMFGMSGDGYQQRVLMVKEAARPARWLDVGAGHGHFCCAARDELPDTRFDGLDLADSIDEAVRRRWIDTGYRGLFPDLAPSLAGRYDALSMSHYLEHTLDPRQELEAAHIALAPGGHLMIEVPDPEYRLGRVLGRWWLPWFQPQHQHLLSTRNLDKLLREHGFTPIAWHRGAAHQRVDFLFAVALVLGRMAPPTNVPWRPGGAVARARRTVVWTLGLPFLLAGWLTDHAIAPIVKRGGRSNTYRVLARREA
jgi:SAM-dependent methyltransferase